jgi:hypothetical protein
MYGGTIFELNFTPEPPSDLVQLCETHEATVAGHNAANLSISGNRCPWGQTNFQLNTIRLTSA